MKSAFNKIAEEAVDDYGNKLLQELDFGKHKVKDKHSSSSRGISELPKRKKPIHVHDEVLKPLITDAMKMSSSREQFREILNDVGVDVEYRTADVSQRTNVRRGPSRDYGDYILYRIVDMDLIPPGQKLPRNLAVKSYKLGDDYGLNALANYIEKNNAENNDVTESELSDNSLITDYDLSDICLDEDELSFEMDSRQKDHDESEEEMISADSDVAINIKAMSDDEDSLTAYRNLLRMKSISDVEKEDLNCADNKEIE